MASNNQDEYINTSEFLEPEDSMKIGSEFTEITPLLPRVSNVARNECQSFKARRYGQWWILKCVSKKVVDKSRVYEYLRKEFVVGISLWHPNIVRMISIQPDLVDGAPGIVLEYIDGTTLTKFLATNPPLDERMKIASQMISAMRYYMAKQVVHCDLKPDNVIITHNGHNVKIIDFGLADLDNFNVFKGHAGTDCYAAPEQKRSDGVVDCRSDFYAFGHILKLLKLPRSFGHIIRRCLKERQEERYQNPTDLYLDFESARTYRLPKWSIIVVAMGALITVCAFVLGNWASKNMVKPLTTSRDQIVDGKMPALYFGDSVKIHSGGDEVYVVPNATTLHYLPNSRPIPGHVSAEMAVDLGLSVKWAPYNVGCAESSSNSVGGFYNWGDASGENIDGELKPYNFKRQSAPITGTQFDIAHVHWGAGWRMPTAKEFQELIDKCRWTLINKRGAVKGYLVTGPSGKCIFLPFAGYRKGPAYFKQGLVGCYWSASPFPHAEQASAYFLVADDDAVSIDQGDFAMVGYSVRPVINK